MCIEGGGKLFGTLYFHKPLGMASGVKVELIEFDKYINFFGPMSEI